MYDKIKYEETYCPEHLDKDNPYNYRRKFYALPYLNEEDIPPCSDGDTMIVTYSPLIGDTDLDNYTVGVWMRLVLLDNYNHPWQEIFQWGNQDSVTKAINILIENGYVRYNKEQQTLRLLVGM